MRKIAALAAVLTLGAAVPTASALEVYDLPAELLAFIAAVPASDDFAVGSGKFSNTQKGLAEQFNFSAHGTLSGARGTLRINSATFGEARAEVTCLAVMGNQAGIAAEFPPDEPLGGEFSHFILAVEDNGEPSGGMADRALFVPSDADLGEPNCGIGLLGSFFSEAISQGNIVVKNR